MKTFVRRVPVSAGRVVILGAALACALLGLTLLDGFGPWKPSRVGSAGEWFAGVAGFAVVVWAVGEPGRQRRSSEQRSRQDRDRKAIEDSVRAISDSRLRPGEKLPDDASTATKARDLHDLLEIERRLFVNDELRTRVHVATEFLRRIYQFSSGAPAVGNREFERVTLRLLVPRVLESTNAALFAELDSKELPEWRWADDADQGNVLPPWPRDVKDVERYISEFTFPTNAGRLLGG